MDELISVIIPVYNVELYLERCIDSVINQTYKDLEIILVDDGSTEKSSEICDQYKTKDRRIKVIHKENGGLSDARNHGFQVAVGEYVFFLDSDDWLHLDAIQVLHNLMIKHNAQISIANFCYQYDSRQIIAQEITDDIILNRNQAMELLLENKKIKNFAWGKLYKRELLINHPFPKGKLFEDIYWTHLIFDQAKKVVISSQVLVYYYQRSTSISYSFNIKKFDLIEGYLERRKFVKERYPIYLHYIDEILFHLLLSLFVQSVRYCNYKDQKKFKKRILSVGKNLVVDCKETHTLDNKSFKEFSDFLRHPYVYTIRFYLKCFKDKMRG